MSLNSDNSTARDNLEASTITPIKEPLTNAEIVTKRPVPLLLLLTGVWIAGSIWLYLYEWNGSSKLAINDGDAIVAKASDNVTFEEGSATATMSALVEEALKKANKYVAERPDKVLVITGMHGETESETNLGEQRATSLKAKMNGWGLNSDYILTSGKAGKLKTKDGTTYGGANFEVKTIPNRFLELESGDFSAKAEDNLTFAKNSAEIGEPVSESVQKTAKEVAAFLKANPKGHLRITGWRGTSEDSDELDFSAFNRGQALKAWWMKMGVPENQIIVIDDNSKQDLMFIGDKVFGGASYQLNAVPSEMDNATADKGSTEGDDNKATTTGTDNNTSEASDEDVEKALAQAPTSVTIYFDYDSDIAHINEADRAALATYIKYLNANKDKKVTLAGYTDDKGSIQYNMALSGRRAANIQKHLSERKVAANQMVIKKMGIIKSTLTGKDAEKERAKSRKVELSVN